MIVIDLVKCVEGGLGVLLQKNLGLNGVNCAILDTRNMELLFKNARDVN